MARVLVGVKRVLDHNILVQVNSDHSGISTETIQQYTMNPFDEIAVEEAVLMKERNEISEVLAVTCGPPKSENVLRNALAMGADKAIHVEVPETDYEKLEPIHISQILAKLAKDEKVDMVLLGKQAIDDDCNNTAQMTAAYLDWPQGTFVSKIEKSDGLLNIKRQIDGGFQNIKLQIPAVISADLQLNTPRYITLPKAMKAKKKKIRKIPLLDFGINTSPRIEILSYDEPPPKTAGVILPDVDSLLAKLKEAKCI